MQALILLVGYCCAAMDGALQVKAVAATAKPTAAQPAHHLTPVGAREPHDFKWGILSGDRCWVRCCKCYRFRSIRVMDVPRCATPDYPFYCQKLMNRQLVRLPCTVHESYKFADSTAMKFDPHGHNINFFDYELMEIDDSDPAFSDAAGGGRAGGGAAGQ